MKTTEIMDKIIKHNEKTFYCNGHDGRKTIAKMVEQLRTEGGMMIDVISVYAEEEGYKDAIPLAINDITIKYDWTEVIEPVDFLTAYSDCLENGTKYKGFGTDRGQDAQSLIKSCGIVELHDSIPATRKVLTCMWIKEN